MATFAGNMGYFTFSVQPWRCSAGIAAGLRVFRMPCRWTFNMSMYMWSMTIVIVIVSGVFIIIIIIMIIVITTIIIIPSPMKISCFYFQFQQIRHRGWKMFDPLWRYGDSFFHLAYLSKGEVHWFIPYEDELMWLEHSTYFTRGLVNVWSLVKISWCDYTIQHICYRGGGFMIPYE